MNARIVSPADVAVERAEGSACELIDVRLPIEFGELHTMEARCPRG